VTERKKTLVVGPDLRGMGGISRVSRVLSDSGIFKELNIIYINSATDEEVNQLLFFIRNFLKYLRLIGAGVRIVYVHVSSGRSFYRKSCFLLPAIIFRRKVVLHIHPTHFYDFLLSLSGLRKRFALFILRSVGAFVVLTEDMRSRISGMFPGKPVYVLRNPIDPELYEKPGNFSRQSKRLLYLGWFVRDKGVYDLVDAAEILDSSGIDFELYFHGRRGKDELAEYVQKKNLDERVHVEGWLQHDEKVKTLYQSGMLILPSYSEGIPNVILEAMVTGTPILSTAEGGLSEVLTDDHNALITEAGNPLKLSSDIMRMIEDDSLRQRLTDNARREVREKYDVRTVRESFRDIIGSVAE